MRILAGDSLNRSVIYSILFTETTVLWLPGKCFSASPGFSDAKPSAVFALFLCPLLKGLLQCNSFLMMSSLVIPAGSDLYLFWSTRAIITFCLVIQYGLVETHVWMGAGVQLKGAQFLALLLLSKKTWTCQSASLSQSEGLIR